MIRRFLVDCRGAGTNGNPDRHAKARCVGGYMPSIWHAWTVFKMATRLTKSARETLSVPHVEMPA